jgi:thiol-disulfide isomerase/thioredoxin
VLTLSATACSSGTDSVGGSGEIISVKPADRKPAPALGGKTVDGGTAQLSAYKGKVVVINVWGSWCAPCRAEAPNLARVAKADAAKGVQFLGINTHDPSPANAASFDARFDIPYPSFYDPYGKLILRFPKGTLNPQSIPSTLVVDRQGRIAARVLEATSVDELNRLIDPIVAEQ